MNSFNNHKLENTSWPNAILNLIGRIREYRGKQDLYKQQPPEVLETLKRTAFIQSISSSNRLEGIEVEEKRLSLLVEGVKPLDRSESEVAGYRDVLALIHASTENIQIKPGTILQFHRDLMNYATGSGGSWKLSDNQIIEHLTTGETRVRFNPVPAWQTPEAVEKLTTLFTEIKARGMVDDLILSGAFVLDFLSIHPFLDGNGRMARLMTLLLLYQSGFEVGRFISLEKIVEDTKEQYYETLEKSSQRWHEGNHDLLPWLEYYLTMILRAYQHFEERVNIVVAGQKGWKEKQVESVIMNMIGDFTIAEVEDKCPGISKPTIQRVLNRLRRAGRIKSLGRGCNARWAKN